MTHRLQPRPARRPGRTGLLALVTVSGLVGLAGLVAAVSTTGDGAGPPPGDEVARSSRGPQGRVPQFVVECDFSHFANDDPIVHPGQPGRSHLHAFFGNTGADADSTAASLRDTGGTTCDQQLDRASYWVPALLAGDEPVVPERAVAYYRPGPSVDPATVRPYPDDLAMVAGDALATEPQPTTVVSWSCGTGGERRTSPPSCEDDLLRFEVTFPDCWDGRNADRPDHASHLAYSRGGACPGDHPVPIPQLILAVDHDFDGSAVGLRLSSGGLGSGHADFLNGWDPQKLEREVAACLHRELVCGVVGSSG